MFNQVVLLQITRKDINWNKENEIGKTYINVVILVNLIEFRGGEFERR